MRQEGAANILWVPHANNADCPQDPWNRFENYYSGDDYIDCLEVSAYGALTPMEEEWPEFHDDNPAHDTSMRPQDNSALASVFREWVDDQRNVLGRIYW